jgi:hypothetical protein
MFFFYSRTFHTNHWLSCSTNQAFYLLVYEFPLVASSLISCRYRIIGTSTTDQTED